MPEETDEMIAHAVQAGDTDSFGELVNRYEPKLKRYGRRFLSGKEDIEDLVQDVFIKAYQHIQSFDTSRTFSPWIYRIAHNVFVNELKRRSRYGSPVFDFDTIVPTLRSQETADAESLTDDMRVEVERVLHELSPKYRDVIVLHYFESLSYQEISDVLRIPISTVGVRINRAKKQIKTLLNDTYNNNDV